MPSRDHGEPTSELGRAGPQDARAIFGIATTPKQRLPETATVEPGVIPFVEHIARRLGAAASFERALLFNHIEVSRMSAGKLGSVR